METQLSTDQIKWPQVWSLVALDVAIIISWIAYHEYQPGLLKQFKFDGFTLELIIVQGIILFITPPIAGLIADNIRKTKGDRLPVINVGINFVSMVFMAVAFTVFANPGGFIRYLFPVMVVLWLISMNIFHSPAISTVELFVPPQKLPQVMAIFAVVAGLAEAIEPSIVDIIEIFGAPATFAVGGILVFSTGWMLQKTTKSLSVQNNDEIHQSYQNIKRSDFKLVFILGLGMGIFTTIFFKILPDLAVQRISFVNNDSFRGTFFVSIMAGTAAVLSLPISFWVEKFGVKNAALIGHVALAIITLGIYFNPYAGINPFLFFLFPVAYSIISVSSLPIAFLSLTTRQKVLGIGLFFSGVELAGSLLDVYQTF